MTSNRHFVMLAFILLALGLSFTAGMAANSESCSPSDCDQVCQVVCAEDCEAVCPPECIVICEEVCAGDKTAVCAPSGCGVKSRPSGSLTALDPAASLSFKLASGQGTEIAK